MKMWSMKVITLLLFCYASISTGNRKVYFVSKNFYNVLHWDPEKPALPAEKVLYSVKYWSDVNETYQIKHGCQNITALFCDLTDETRSVYDVNYRAQVYSDGRFYDSTKRFKPISDTTLGPPILSNYTTVSSLLVNVTMPLGPKRVSVSDIITNSKKGPFKPIIVYTLEITHPEWAKQINQTTTGRFVINLKNNRTKYCGYVFYKVFSEWNRPESEKAFFCATLPDDPLMLLPWFLVSAALLMVLIITAVVCMCKYVKGGKGKSMPELLVTTSSTPPRLLQCPDTELIISKAEICTQSDDQTFYATIRMQPNKPSVGSGGYSPQDIPWKDSTGSSVGTDAHSPTPNPEDMSAQSSEIYSVIAVHVPTEQNEDFQQASNEIRETSNPPLSSSGESWDKGGADPNLISHGVAPLPELDPWESNPAGQLLLQTVRDANGQLALPSLIFQLQDSTDDAESPFNTERKPLLSDLIPSKTEGPSLASLKSFDSSEWSDSGCDDSTVTTPTQHYCNTHYSPTQPVVPYFRQVCQNTQPCDAIFESSYKQNWIPEMLLGTSTKDSSEYRIQTDYPMTWTGTRKKEEGEDDNDRRGEEGQIILEGWVVQTQE